MNRRLLTTIFGRDPSWPIRPDNVCIELDTFAVEVIMGSGFEFRGRSPTSEFREFHNYYDKQITPIIWNRIFEQYKANDKTLGDCHPVFEFRNKIVSVCWFQRSMEISDWTDIKEPCPITKKLVPFKNGFYKSVLIE